MATPPHAPGTVPTRSPSTLDAGGAAEPPSRARGWPPWARGALVLAVVAVTVTGILLGSDVVRLTSSSDQVTVTGLGFEWESPPSVICPVASVISESLPLTLDPSAQLTVSWQLACSSPSYAGSTYAIQTVAVVSGIPFTVLHANVPVLVQYGGYSVFNVTLEAPSYSWSGQVYLLVTASVV